MTKQPRARQLIRISDDHSKLQLNVIHGYLTRSYWAQGIPKHSVQKSIDNSLCFAAFADDKQVAFARVITDKASFAYLADVFVLEQYQGLGLSKKLMAAVIRHPDLQNIRRFMLCTADAHTLYEKFGFSIAAAPENLMAIHKPDIYNDMAG